MKYLIMPGFISVKLSSESLDKEYIFKEVVSSDSDRSFVGMLSEGNFLTLFGTEGVSLWLDKISNIRPDYIYSRLSSVVFTSGPYDYKMFIDYLDS